MATAKQYQGLKEFYPYYLSEHQNPSCRKLHCVGITLVFIVLAWALITLSWWELFLAPVVGYGFAAAADRMGRACFLRTKQTCYFSIPGMEPCF